MQHLKESLNNFKHHSLRQFLATITIGFSILILSFAVTFFNISQEKLANLSNNFDLQIYLNNNIKTEEINKFKNAIEKNFKPEKIVFINKEQALLSLEENFPNQIETFNELKLENPLPHHLKIKTQNIITQEQILKFVQKPEYQNILLETQFSNNLEKVRENFFSFSKTSKQLLLWTLFTFIIVLSLIMVNIVHLSLLERHKEIKLKQLIGADFNYIKIPFLIESLILTVLSYISGLILIVTADIFVPYSILSNLNLSYFVGQFVLILIICSGSTYFIIEHHLKNQTFLQHSFK